MSDPAREIAVAILRRRDEILVSPVPDHVKGITGWRAPGGGIESGERAEEAVVREIREELGVTVIDPQQLATIDNVFVYLGRAGHELVHVYAVAFEDDRLYEIDRFECVESGGVPFACVWRPISAFGPAAPLYPEGLLSLLG